MISITSEYLIDHNSSYLAIASLSLYIIILLPSIATKWSSFACTFAYHRPGYTSPNFLLYVLLEVLGYHTYLHCMHINSCERAGSESREIS
ncbi:hypothetical protein EDB19DRAFT_1202853 [Suillus lakei]|nr:hypothetical protein EDB19DRAFT_1202853 [Suillus lakei]